MTVDATTVQAKKAMPWVGWIFTGFVGLFMLFDSLIKFMNIPAVAESTAKLGFSASSTRLIAIIELVVTLIYLVPRTSVLGVILLTGLLGGTVASHLRVDDPMLSHVLFGAYLAVIAWGGLWLRDARLRALIPLRRP